MDALLPSEIARLVFGYLQEQQCDEAAKVFMETSKHLKECRIVSQRGGKYSTKVGGLSLIDILDKYCTVNAMVQEKLNKVSDCEQLKNCADLIEQLRYILEGTRGHRFVVNISVPSQNSSAGAVGSPNISGSTRKRHHSNSEREKRVSKSLNSLMEKSAQNLDNQNCDTVEATLLETLPGHIVSTKQIATDKHTVIPNDIAKFNNTSNTLTISTVVDSNLDKNVNIPTSNNLRSSCKEQSTETIDALEDKRSKCTAGTNTEELLNYCTVEVQTGPNDFVESESDVNDEPIENLSLLTKELLQRTELHERIAENINKTILPESSHLLKSNADQTLVEGNVSLLSDLGNAIKSVVKATETDPIFEGFLKEIFTVSETDTSPDEDSETRQNQISNEKICIQDNEPMEVDYNSELIEPTDRVVIEQENNKIEIPLKQRLRSSLKSLTNNLEEEEKESISLLENQNAEAVASIVNVITNRRNSLASNDLDIQEVPNLILPENLVDKCMPTNSNIEPEKINDIKVVKPISKKSSNKKVKVTKPNDGDRLINEANAQLISEQDIMTMPTLILCSENEIEPFLPTSKPKPNEYIPIAPKLDGETPSASIQIYLRTVNVPRHLVSPAQIEASAILQQTAAALQHPIVSGPMHPDNGDSNVVPIVVADQKVDTSCAIVTNSSTPIESITLYGGEIQDDCSEMKVAPVRSLGMINVDDDSFGLGRSGLSPLFKNTESNVVQVKQEPKKDQLQTIKKNIESVKPTELLITEQIENSKVTKECKQSDAELKSSKINESDVIAKNTPRTLMESRAKNNRLSLSTPRRRNSHIRALDFSTPGKLSNNMHKTPQSCTKSKSVCRGSLFKTPQFSDNTSADTPNLQTTEDCQFINEMETLSPVDHQSLYMQVPIATRSPAPKLQGNWGKVTGIGLILGETSQSESSPEKFQTETSFFPTLSPDTIEVAEQIDEKPVIKKDWDSELRKIAGLGSQEKESSKPSNEKKTMSTRRSMRTKSQVSTILKGKTKEKNVTLNKKEKNNDVNKFNKDEKKESNNKGNDNNLKSKKNNVDQKNEIAQTTKVVKKKISLQLSKSPKSIKSNKRKVSSNFLDPGTCLPNIPDYVTPRKIETKATLPPTPRLYTTPADSLKKCKHSKPNPDRSIKAGVDTPDFPVTPCIVLTPKILEEEGKEKRPSPYYEPSEETIQGAKEKVINTVTISVKDAATLSKQKGILELQQNKALIVEENEILQKKTEQKEELLAQLLDKKSKEILEDESVEETIVSTNSNSDSGDESDSNSCNSSSSSNNSSSSSSYSDVTPSPTKSIAADEDCRNDNSTTESEIHSPEKILQNFSVLSQDDIHRVEVQEGSLKDTDAAVKDTMDELPKTNSTKKKNIHKRIISKKPTNSESMMEHHTHNNVPLKTPTVDATFQSDQITKKAEESQNKEIALSMDIVTHALSPRLKSTNNQKIIPPENMMLQVSGMLQSDIQKNSATALQQQKANNDAKLAQELEEKRLRVMAKFKETSNPKNINHLKKPTTVKKIMETEKIVLSTTNTLKSKSNTQVKKVAEKSEMLTKINNTKLQNNNCEEAINEPKNGKGKISPRKKTQNHQQCNTENVKIAINNKKKITQNVIKEVEISAIPIVAENSKGISKTKVDHVKRDLFSEEVNDQRTTRSQAARRSVDNQKNDENRDINTTSESSKESLPGVLECLELIPANKSELDLSNKSIGIEGLSNSQTNALEFMFTYDESVPIKKRKRKYSSSELVTEYTLENVDDDESRALNATAYEEMFKMAPSYKKKTPKKSTSTLKQKKSRKKVDKHSVNTSSPLTKVQTMDSCIEDNRRKCSKRKTVPTKDEQVEKKSKPDPLTLLNKIKIDEFLKSVHIPH